MTGDLSIVEGSEYEHEELGRVTLVSIDEETDELILEREETTYVSGVGEIPVGVRASRESFVSQAEPADISVAPPTVEISAESLDIQ